ncbi:muscleblind-like protein [Holotrichia oblita]|uniref:Muscleblind-like protein n=1 Tax=Holotrichia oblita TaxID=644536 RepID=A0ACB9TEV5_HOLOL|nr:muscleblind-like protein [Holotrichia oblita]
MMFYFQGYLYALMKYISDAMSDTSDDIKAERSSDQNTESVCRDFTRGACDRKFCKYKHETEIRSLNFCYDFQNASCPRPNCKFIHCTTEEEEEYKKTGEMSNQILAEASRKNQLPGIQPVCNMFRKGICRRPVCKYRHITKEEEDCEIMELIRNNSNNQRNRFPFNNNFQESHFNHLNGVTDITRQSRLNFDDNDYEPLPKRRFCSRTDFTETGVLPPDFHRKKAAFRGYFAANPPPMLGHLDARTIMLEEENSLLHKEIAQLKRQVSDLTATNEFLLDQNATLRVSSKRNASVTVPAVTLTNSLPQNTPPQYGSKIDDSNKQTSEWNKCVKCIDDIEKDITGDEEYAHAALAGFVTNSEASQWEYVDEIDLASLKRQWSVLQSSGRVDHSFSLEEFIDIDNDVVVAELPSDEEIVDTIKRVEEPEEEDEREDCTTKPSRKQVKEALAVVIRTVTASVATVPVSLATVTTCNPVSGNPVSIAGCPAVSIAPPAQILAPSQQILVTTNQSNQLALANSSQAQLAIAQQNLANNLAQQAQPQLTSQAQQLALATTTQQLTSQAQHMATQQLALASAPQQLTTQTQQLAIANSNQQIALANSNQQIALANSQQSHLTSQAQQLANQQLTSQAQQLALANTLANNTTQQLTSQAQQLALANTPQQLAVANVPQQLALASTSQQLLAQQNLASNQQLEMHRNNQMNAINTSQAIAMSNATQPMVSYPIMTQSINHALSH